jgi:hypothetical protein
MVMSSTTATKETPSSPSVIWLRAARQSPEHTSLTSSSGRDDGVITIRGGKEKLIRLSVTPVAHTPQRAEDGVGVDGLEHVLSMNGVETVGDAEGKYNMTRIVDDVRLSKMDGGFNTVRRGETELKRRKDVRKRVLGERFEEAKSSESNKNFTDYDGSDPLIFLGDRNKLGT